MPVLSNNLNHLRCFYRATFVLDSQNPVAVIEIKV